MMTVEFHPGPPVSVGEPKFLFLRPDRVRPGQQIAGLMDISPDDRRFLMVRNVPLGAQGEEPRLVLMQNFFEELKAKMGK